MDHVLRGDAENPRFAVGSKSQARVRLLAGPSNVFDIRGFHLT